MKKAKPYIVSILISVGVGLLSAFFTRNSMDIYSEIVTPPLSPPSVLFPIVWTVLFVLMGVSCALVYTDKTPAVPYANTEKALVIYAISLVVNFLWSIIFFNLRFFGFSFVWLLLLWFLIFLTIREYLKINKTAAYLQIPYLVWVTFAGYLNLGIWILNR